MMDFMLTIIEATSQVVEDKQTESAKYGQYVPDLSRVSAGTEYYKDSSYFDPETNNNETYIITNKSYGVVNIEFYVPEFTIKDYSVEKPYYQRLVNIFNEYYQSNARTYVGYRSQILDHNRFDFLLRNFDNISKENSNLNLTLDDLFRLYSASFDSAWLGNNQSKEYTYLGAFDHVKDIRVGPKCSEYLKNITIEQSKGYRDILDQSDIDYRKLTKDYNDSYRKSLQESLQESREVLNKSKQNLANQAYKVGKMYRK